MLNELRGRIDELDKEIVSLFEQRMDAARQVGEYKRENGMQTLVPGREDEVLKSRVAMLENKEYSRYTEQLFKELMSLSRELQESRGKAVNASRRAVYCGEPGCYAEEAGDRFFAGSADLKSVHSFSEVFKTVEAGGAEYGILPIENTSTGFIRDVLDLLAEYNCCICGETAITVRHCLLGVRGAHLSDIREVYSHQQGLEQSSEFLDTLPGIKRIPYINTATSARYVAEQADITKAAVAGERAGELYGLDILKKGINQKLINSTRFIIIGKKPYEGADADKVSIAFTLEHRAGTLYRALSHFSAAGLNLLHIESRPLSDKNFEYLFHVDFEGNLRSSRVKDALHAVGGECSILKIFGSYRSINGGGADG